MSLEAMVWALKHSGVTDPVAKLVLIGLADHAHDDGTCAWPSQSTLATYAGVSVRTVYTKLTTLEDQGLISPGDQELVSHIRADRQPHVWNLSMATGGNLLPGGNVFRAEIDDTTGGNLRSHGRKSASDKPSLKPVQNRPSKMSDFPEDWQPNQGHEDFAYEHDLNLAFEASQFESHHRSKGSRFKNWDAAFRTWLGNQVRWSRPRLRVADDTLPEWMR